ncbi:MULTISPECIES: sugar phosphate isomerase/epimerase family protein [Enterococcus]|uniref:Sugar phosphate isomerase/epimerase n=1 Tax=Candidatus Enterococcus murrayae TaxID=2815321 RepID=A0ABS3HCN9_9ENTE|nr:sugar phosphate isomerase/epimerase [Enterococcus sp. MJM16]MBO0450983.1 sugar phosphate isomerase/epimerase [Enterococcus sp. MJM16]
MKLGFLTNCFEGRLLDKVILAKQLGYSQLEVSLTPSSTQRLIAFDAASLNSKLLEYEIRFSSLAYYQNILTEQKDLRRMHVDNLYTLIDFAFENGIPQISTFLGRDSSKSIAENFTLLNSLVRPIVEYAEQLKIKIAIENCSMPSWDENGFPATISYSPELWDEMFSRIPNENFGLNFDPSHLIWQKIDYTEALTDYYDRIFNLHVKEIFVETDNLSRYGIFGKQIERKHPNDFGWYRPAPLGLGSIDWRTIFEILKDNHYSKDLTLEFKSESKSEAEQMLIHSKKYIEECFNRKDVLT